jgi:hypothetical protein
MFRGPKVIICREKITLLVNVFFFKPIMDIPICKSKRPGIEIVALIGVLTKCTQENDISSFPVAGLLIVL